MVLQPQNEEEKRGESDIKQQIVDPGRPELVSAAQRCETERRWEVEGEQM